MQTKFWLSALCFLPCALTSAVAATEGVPQYYKSGSGGQLLTAPYVGDSSKKQVIGQRSQTYQTPVPKGATGPATTATGAGTYGGTGGYYDAQGNYVAGTYSPAMGTMTTAGIGMPASDDSGWSVSAGYTRKFANFQFETGVNSILKWDDMVFDEIGVAARNNFSLRNFDMFAYGEYRMGFFNHGGLSMDYDLKPFDKAYPDQGIFTISMGDQTGKTDYMRFGLGAHKVWDIGGWKISPSVGYEIFHHKLEMSNHIYPNPGVYLPLMNQYGDYIFGDDQGNFYSIPQGTTNIPDNYYQVCMSPEDIMVASSDPNTHAPVVAPNGDGSYSLVTQEYNPLWGTLPWGVGPGECVIIGGDGMIIVKGTTHIYDTTWSGPFIGLEIEKQLTLADKLRFYAQVGMPHYSSAGTWPNRTDWQQNPSFIDEGSNNAYSYAAELEYQMKISERVSLSLKVNTDYYYVGKIGGKLYVAEYTSYAVDSNGQYILDANGYPTLVTTPAHTEHIKDSLNYADWQSFGVSIGVKYTF